MRGNLDNNTVYLPEGARKLDYFATLAMTAFYLCLRWDCPSFLWYNQAYP
jgi:hypothetical protein